MSWPDLAYFNWGTKDAEEIKKHLASNVGCTKKTPDGNDFVFSSSDEPGVVRIPKPFSERGLATGKMNVMRVERPAPFDEQFVLVQENGRPISRLQFEVVRGDGTKFRGVTDEKGRTGLHKSIFSENIAIRILRKGST